jgi:hypothetical protein
MASIDLPRPLQDYFAFAETTPTRHGRRFSITLPYLRPDGRLDRLQWWYHLSPAKEKALGDQAPDRLRAEAIERFKNHIARWLQNTRQDMFGDGTIPNVTAEGNQILAAFPMDPAASAGMLQSSDDAPADALPAAVDARAAGLEPPDLDQPSPDSGSDRPPGSATVDEEAPEPLSANKTAFG